MAAIGRLRRDPDARRDAGPIRLPIGPPGAAGRGQIFEVAARTEIAGRRNGMKGVGETPPPGESFVAAAERRGDVAVAFAGELLPGVAPDRRERARRLLGQRSNLVFLVLAGQFIHPPAVGVDPFDSLQRLGRRQADQIETALGLFGDGDRGGERVPFAIGAGAFPREPFLSEMG